MSREAPPDAAVLLAAGASRRLGHPKALVPFRGRPLISRAVLALQRADFAPVVVVVGADREAVVRPLDRLDRSPEIVVHRDWSDGLSSSIRCGVEYLLSERAPRSITLVGCDQVHLDRRHLARLRAGFDGDAETRVASRYAGTLGIPALFGSAWYEKLLSLEGDRGARSLLRPPEVRGIDWPEGEFDLDSPGDLERLRRLDPGDPGDGERETR